jgi:hypothetical protein
LRARIVGRGGQAKVSEFRSQVAQKFRCFRQSLSWIEWTVQMTFSRGCRHELSNPDCLRAAARQRAYGI